MTKEAEADILAIFAPLGEELAPKAKKKPKVKQAPVNTEEFQEFWAAYPRREAKGKARASFTSAMQFASFEQIMGGLRRQLPILATRDPQFIPLPATWLNQERWEDELKPVGKPKAQARPGDMADFTQDLMGRFYEREREYVPTAGDRGSQHALAHIAFKERH